MPSIRSTGVKHICWAPPQGSRGKVGAPHPQPNPTTPNDSNHHDPRIREVQNQPSSCALQVWETRIRPCPLRRAPSST